VRIASPHASRVKLLNHTNSTYLTLVMWGPLSYRLVRSGCVAESSWNMKKAKGFINRDNHLQQKTDKLLLIIMCLELELARDSHITSRGHRQPIRFGPARVSFTHLRMVGVAWSG
jgi:hypothetical protein